MEEKERPRRIGRAWIKNAWRNIYASRQIKRGKHKGKLEVTYINRPGVFATEIVEDIKEV